MSTMMVPANMDDAMKMLEAAVSMQQCALVFLGRRGRGRPARAGRRGPAPGLGTDRRGRSRPRGRLLEVFDAQDGHLADGQRTTRTWLIHSLRVTRGQAAEYRAVQALARGHRVLHAALAEGWVLTSPRPCSWPGGPGAIPDEYRAAAEDILVAAARAGVDLRGLAAICAEIRACTARPDPDDDNDKHLDRGVSLDTTFDGAGVVHGDLTPECTAMVQAVLDALSAPPGGGDLRTRPQRYHDALAEAMRRLLASDLLPRRAGQPVKALVHIYFAELRDRDQDGVLQDKWIAEYRARWAAHRAAASVSTGDGGAWLEGDAAREVACDAMIIPVVTGDIDPGAVDDLIALCVRYHQLRTQTAPADPPPAPNPPAPAPPRTARHPGRPGRQRRRPGRADQHRRPPRRGHRRGRRRAGRRWSSRSWARSCRSSPGPAAPPPSCAATCSASPWPGPPSPSTSARPTTSPCTCAAWSRCGTRRASTPAAATSPPPAVNPTTSSTDPTAATPASRTSKITVTGTTTSSCTNSAGP